METLKKPAIAFKKAATAPSPDMPLIGYMASMAGTEMSLIQRGYPRLASMVRHVSPYLYPSSVHYC